MTDITKQPADDPGSDSLQPADASGAPQDATSQAPTTTPEPLSSLPADDPSQTPEGGLPHAEEEHHEAAALTEDPSQHAEVPHPAEYASPEEPAAETSREAAAETPAGASAETSAETSESAETAAAGQDASAADAEDSAPPPPAPPPVEPSDDELLAEARRWGVVDEEGNVRQLQADGSPGRILGPAAAPRPMVPMAPMAPITPTAPIAESLPSAEPQTAAETSEPGEPGEPGEAAASDDAVQAAVTEPESSEPRTAEPETAEPATAELQTTEPGTAAEPEVASVDAAASDRALLRYARKYRQVAAKVGALEREAERAADRSRLIGRVHSLQTWLPTGDVLGDVDALLARLAALEESCRGQLQENLRRKEELSSRAAELVESTAWTKTAEAFKGLQAEWKKIGPVPAEEAEALWGRFRESANRFFERRKAHLDERDRGQLENLRQKEELCVRAEELAASTAWTKTAEALKVLQDEWRKIGPVPREQAEAVWARFRAAMDAFFERRKAHFRQIDQELKENLRRKEALAVQAEELRDSSDWKATTESIKAMQAEWKSIGPVPHKQSEAIWARFRGAIDVFFARSSSAYEERVRDRQGRQGEWKDRLRETLDRKREQADRIRESIGRDDENLERWRGTLETLRPGPRAAEIQTGLDEKIATVNERRASKQSRLDELEAAIKELEGRLA